MRVWTAVILQAARWRAVLRGTESFFVFRRLARINGYTYILTECTATAQYILMSITYKDGKEVMTKTVKTTDAPYKIELMPYKNTIAVEETAIINVRIADKNGITVPTADNQIFFTVEGGQFLGCGNGNPGSHENDKIPVRRAFNGLCQLLVKATDSEMIKVTAQSDGLKQGICAIKARER